MNNRGQVWGYSLMLALVVIILALALAPAGKSFIDTARSNSTSDFVGLECDKSTISDFQKAGCVVTDLSLAYFFGGIILIGIGIILARVSFGGEE